VHTTAKALDRVFDNMDIDANGLISEEEFLSCFGFGPLRHAAARVHLQVGARESMQDVLPMLRIYAKRAVARPINGLIRYPRLVLPMLRIYLSFYLYTHGHTHTHTHMQTHTHTPRERERV